MPGDPLYPASRLDANQVLTHSFDEATQRIRVQSDATIVNADIDVALDAAEDNVAIATPDGDFLEINPDGSINITDNGGSLTVDANNLDIRDLVFATDKADVTGSVIDLSASTLSALETITAVQGAPNTVANSWPVKITDGVDTALVTAAGEMNVFSTARPGVDIGDVTINNAAGASAVNIQDGGNSITVDATNFGIRNLTFATDIVNTSGSTMSGLSPTSVATTLRTDENGALIVSTQHANNFGVSNGEVTTAAVTTVSVYKTAYVEQIANAQRSLVSSDVNDTAAGLGARQVTIYYVPIGGTTLKNEVVTLNGITPVNTTNTDICYIERMEVTLAGLAATNFGTISLYTGTAGAGTVFGSIAITDNRTFWAHHYVPGGKTCKVNSISISSTANASGEAANFFMLRKAGFLGISLQITGMLHLHGTQSTVVTRPYSSPLVVTAGATNPFLIVLRVTPGNTNVVTQYGAFDWTES